MYFHECDILTAINKLKSNFTLGPDGFPPIFFKQLKHVIALPLTLIYNQLMSVAYVPDTWKMAVITPVFKKGVITDCCNYRPISVTCVTSKIFERVVSRYIHENLLCNDILHPSQHGFLKGHSTCTSLLESLNDWTLALQDRHGVVIVYVDFSKAFDVVSHNKLFARLHSYGIQGNLLLWLRNFFSGRSHCTKVGNNLSDFLELISGVVQGMCCWAVNVFDVYK